MMSLTPEPPIVPRVGDKVTARDLALSSKYPTSITGDEVNLQPPGTNLEWFRVKTSTLSFVERAKTSNPFTNPDLGTVADTVASASLDKLVRGRMSSL
jgi:hypothetical protein